MKKETGREGKTWIYLAQNMDQWHGNDSSSTKDSDYGWVTERLMRNSDEWKYRQNVIYILYLPEYKIPPPTLFNFQENAIKELT
jgi:hypothetical protein